MNWLKKKNQRLDSLIHERDLLKAHLEEEMRQVSEERQALQELVEEKNQRLDSLIHERDLLKAHLEAASDERVRLHNDLERYIKQVVQTLHQVEKANAQTQATIEERDRFQSKLEDDALKIQSLTNHTEELESQLKKAIGEQKSAQKKWNEAKLALSSHHRSSKMIIEQKENEIRKLNETISDQLKILTTLASSPDRLYAKRLIARRKRLPLVGHFLKKKITAESDTRIQSDYEEIMNSGLFDSQYYQSHVSENILVNREPLHHYCMHGWKEGRNPSPYFNTCFYLLEYPDVANSGMNPLVHYIRHGKSEGRFPAAEGNPTAIAQTKVSPFFSSLEDADGKNASEKPTGDIKENLSDGHNESKDVYDEIGLIAQSGLFDEQYYLKENPDISAADVDPIWHYFVQGWKENRNPCRDFNTAFYLEHNPDVREAGINPLVHYIAQGKTEGRRPIAEDREATHAPDYRQIKKVIRDEFDATFYLDCNPDVKAAGVNPLKHFIRHGWKEGRDPNPYFSVSYYLSKKPDLEKKRN
jgi:hypothetical protein